MMSVPKEWKERLTAAGQGHVLDPWDALDAAQRQGLLSQLEAIDFDLMRKLHARRDKAEAALTADRIEPVPVVSHDAPDATERRREGQEMLRRGEVAALLVAGGQGSRLGFDHPKGMYAVGPISGKSLFQFHAEKVLATARRYEKPVPFLVMTSPATHAETVEFFDQKGFFGLPRDEVFFFQQGTMPSLDLASGRLLMESPGSLFLSPDGHGGTLTALAKSGLLERMKTRGIKHIFYFQVDNPLVKIADPEFLGRHAAAGADVSSKAVAKRGPKEKVGVFAKVDGKCAIVEYIDLPEALSVATDEGGKLKLWAGNPAIHVFDVGFLERMTRDPEKLPFHVAKKKVPHLGDVEPTTENALKFERFIFDTLPAAERWVIVETTREAEFAPLKNADGDDSPATVEAALLGQAREWVALAGGVVAGRVEVSPLYAIDAEELAGKVCPGTRLDGDWYLE